MNKKIKNISFIFWLLLITRFTVIGQELTIKDCLENAIIPLPNLATDNNDLADLHFLKQRLKNKQIIIFGESGHGDGLTFEIKTKLIKFFVKRLDYNVIAFEGGGFWEMFYARHNILTGKSTEKEISNSWFNIWSSSRQTQSLIDFINEHKKKIDILGIENQLGNQYSPEFAGILDSLIGEKAFKGIDMPSFDNNFRLYYYSVVIDTSYRRKVNLPELKSDLKIIKNNLSKINSIEAKVMMQGIINIEGFMKQMDLYNGNYSNQNKAINLRDSLMAENVMWYMNQYPEAKIIVWTANLHAAKNLDQIIYKEDDDFYQKYIPLGQRLTEKFGDKVYSVAFTSISGETATIYQNQPSLISVDENSFDYHLGKEISANYAFIDFEKARNTGNCRESAFGSTILGYHLHDGKWFDVFDGVVFIRTMQRSTVQHE